MNISFDSREDYFSFQAIPEGLTDFGESLRQSILDSSEYAEWLFSQLSEVDYEIARFYYLEQLSQIQTAKVLGISQAAVSRRLEYIRKRVKYLVKMPTSSPLQVREDFKKLFPIKLFEPAYYIYFEPSQSRVKFFLGTSQSGAANKIKQINEYLSNKVQESDKGMNADQLDVKLLATFYYDVFHDTQERASIFTFLFKLNDEIRTGSIELRDMYIEGVKIPIGF